MKNNAGSQQPRQLTEAELQISANKWSKKSGLMFGAGLAAFATAAIAMAYFPAVPQWLNIILCIAGGLLIARARGVKIGT